MLAQIKRERWVILGLILTVAVALCACDGAKSNQFIDAGRDPEVVRRERWNSEHTAEAVQFVEALQEWEKRTNYDARFGRPGK